MIKSFGDKQTEALFDDRFAPRFQRFAKRAKQKLVILNASSRLADLLTPPSNRLERLQGGLREFHSIRVNDQWRVIFRWTDGDAYDVRVVDYH